ncbi:MAG: hypothetical protein AB7V40_11215 [Methyloceanibacter sp.]
MRIIFAIALLLVLVAAGVPESARADGYYDGGRVAIFPNYPYRSGHYPKADWYYQLPPYAAIDPSFYRRRFFMMAQERDRYRYMPHIFRGYGYGDGDGEPIEDINIQGIAGSLRETYGN